MSNPHLSEVTLHCSNRGVFSCPYGQHGAEEFLDVVQEFVVGCQPCTMTLNFPQGPRPQADQRFRRLSTTMHNAASDSNYAA